MFWQGLLVGFLLAAVIISTTIAFFTCSLSINAWINSDIIAQKNENQGIQKIKTC